MFREHIGKKLEWHLKMQMRVDMMAEARRGLEEREANELQAAYDKAERTLRDPESSEEEKARAEEDMHLLTCFGDWAHMGYAQCVRSYGEFKKVIAEGRAVWKEKMEEIYCYFVRELSISHCRS